MKLLIVCVALLCLVCLSCSEKPTNTAEGDTGGSQTNLPPAVQSLINRHAIPIDEESPERELGGILDQIPDELIDNCEVYAITVLWGHLMNTAPPENVTLDWSGELMVNAEAYVHVRNEIDFESGEDSILARTMLSSVSWVSYTRNDFDGINFLVFVNLENEYFMAPMVFFNTELINLQIPFYDLISHDAYYEIDESNGVAVHSRRLWQDACPGGLIAGRWLKDESFGWTGSLHGYWMNHLGDTIGYLDGTYWKDEDNYLGQFVGSVSGLYTDEVIAELHGNWFYDDPRMCPMCGSGHGRFWGNYFMLADSAVGNVYGEFGDWSLPPDDLDMPFIGIWKEHCPWTDLFINTE